MVQLKKLSTTQCTQSNRRERHEYGRFMIGESTARDYYCQHVTIIVDLLLEECLRDEWKQRVLACANRVVRESHSLVIGIDCRRPVLGCNVRSKAAHVVGTKVMLTTTYCIGIALVRCRRWKPEAKQCMTSIWFAWVEFCEGIYLEMKLRFEFLSPAWCRKRDSESEHIGITPDAVDIDLFTAVDRNQALS